MAWDYLNTIGFRGCTKTRQARKYLLHMGFFTCSKMAKVELRRLHVGDVLVTASAHSGDQIGKKCAYVDHLPTLAGGVFFVGELLCIRSDARALDSKWPYFYFLSDAGFQTLQDAVTGVHLTSGRARDMRIPLAPLAEQKRIVAKMEELLARVSAARARLAKAPAILKRFRQSVLAAACSGQLTADWRGSSGKDKGSSDEWQTLRVGNLFKVTTGGTPSRKNPAFFTRGTIPWVKTGEVQNCDIFGTEEHITHDAIENSSAKIFPAGTLLVALYGEGRTRRQVGRLRIDAATNQACAALVNPDMAPETRRYVFFYLLGQYFDLRERSAGGNQPNLSVGLIREWEIQVPPTAEQREIVHRVEKLFALADAIEKRVSAATARAERLTQAILAKAFRGELVPTEADLARREGRDYEAADELLARIRSNTEAPSKSPGKPQSRRGNLSRARGRPQ